ncbi:MAG TPA: S-methyl-5-thioribose-1-phosphate isomerase [Novimethylophilus sp.]|jgi:methylthioribose-1-phosphate isomerase|uniref:S-methyl-5-thioribose-1-phosphate isomerase n=1 Tax=Novimethylophilus sp. TaxID=2137426 RepID=UPI002F3EF9FC
MKIRGDLWRTIWRSADGLAVEVIDQTCLPHTFAVRRLQTLADAAYAIKAMQVRGAPLIGAAAAYGMVLGLRERSDDAGLEEAAQALMATRPTAVNLRWAVQRMLQVLQPLPAAARIETAWREAASICDEDVALNQAIGGHGLALLSELYLKTGAPLNVLTHCNAGWLATVDWGTALAPIYRAFDAGIPLHVWVDETRPRNQGASLTAWELGQHGVPHTVIADNAGGHLMQHGEVDMVIVGADRVTAVGDVCNKIGTYLKALAAFDNRVPFYAAVPSPTIDWGIIDGVREIPIEERDANEVAWVQGRMENGDACRVNVLPAGSAAANPAFDVTPARLVTGIITERGIAAPHALRTMFPD